MEHNNLDNQLIGKKISAYRKKNNWKQSYLGNKIGVKDNTISAYERGHVEIPLSKLKFLATVFDVPFTDLVPIDLIENKNDLLVKSVRDAKSDLSSEQLQSLENLIIKMNSLNGKERENFFDYIEIAVEFYNKKSNSVRDDR